MRLPPKPALHTPDVTTGPLPPAPRTHRVPTSTRSHSNGTSLAYKLIPRPAHREAKRRLGPILLDQGVNDVDPDVQCVPVDDPLPAGATPDDSPGELNSLASSDCELGNDALSSRSLFLRWASATQIA